MIRGKNASSTSARTKYSKGHVSHYCRTSCTQRARCYEFRYPVSWRTTIVTTSTEYVVQLADPAPKDADPNKIVDRAIFDAGRKLATRAGDAGLVPLGDSAETVEWAASNAADYMLGEAAFMLLRWRKVASTPLLTSDYKLWHVTYIGPPTRREVPCNSGAAVGCGPCAIGTDGGPLDPAGGAAIADDFGFTDSPNPFGVGDSPGGVASD